MPWKACHVVDERLRFIARLLDGEKMAQLCAEFGISRKTGYRIYDRYQGLRRRGAERPQSTAVPLRASAPAGRRGGHPSPEEEVSLVGRREDPRAAPGRVARAPV